MYAWDKHTHSSTHSHQSTHTHAAPSRLAHQAPGCSSPTHPPANFSMRVYNDACNGCFAPSSLISMSDGTYKPASAVHKGDHIRCGDGAVTRILCVVKASSSGDLVDLGDGCILTPWHPVCLAGVWRFPCELQRAKLHRGCESVYNFVLEDSRQTLVVGGKQCAALGHTLGADEALRLVDVGTWRGETHVIKHPYFGSLRVRSDLEAMDPVGWQAGHITFAGACLQRDAVSGLQGRYRPDRLVRHPPEKARTSHAVRGGALVGASLLGGPHHLRQQAAAVEAL